MNRRDRRVAAKMAKPPASAPAKSQVSDAAVQIRSDDAALWIQRANTLMESGRADDAIAAFEKALALDPRQWVAACRSGILHHQLGRPERALACFDICNSLNPDHAPTLYMRAVFLRDLKRYDEALADNKRAHELDPGNAETCNNIGHVLQLMGSYEEALPWLDKALALQPNSAEALFNKAASLARLLRYDEGLAAYERLKGLGPNPIVSDAKLGLLLCDLGQSAKALGHLDRALERDPNDANILRRRALALRSLNRFEDALADTMRLHGIEPGDAEICSRIGNLLVLLDREEEALSWLDRALALRPDFVDALVSKASALVGLQRLDEAFEVHVRLKVLDPDNAFTALALAHLHLLAGNFAEGWAGREARWRLPSLPIAHATFSAPMWLGGGSIAGKTILVYSDEGMGDAVQFARYVPMLAERSARVILAVQPALLPLLSALEGVAQCLPATGCTLPPFDLHCPMMSLPLAFGTLLDTIPAQTPYLPPAPTDRLRGWEDRLGPHDRLRVGLVWSGNPKHRNDHNRSILLQQLAGLLDVDADFVSLQKDPRDADRALLAQRPDIMDLTSRLTDFGETAALVTCLDLVITVDTSVAHLAAALGRPTWILLPYTPDCRWLLGRDDSPWYPTVRLFRQDERRSYAPVIERMRGELQALAMAFQAKQR